MITISKSERLKEFQCQFAEQLKCLEMHMNIDNSILGDLNEFYRKRAAVEQEYAESLNRLNQNFRQRLNNEQQRRQSWPKYSSLDLINTLIVANQRTSHTHFVMAKIFGQQMTQRIVDVQEDVLRLQRQSRELLQQCQQNILSTHLKLTKDYKAYSTSYSMAEEAKRNLEKVKEKIDKEEKKYVAKNKDFDKSNKSKKLHDELYEKREFYKSKRLTCTQARNECIIQTAAANRTIEKFFSQEIHDVLECLSYGYHNNLSRAVLNHINCEEALITSHRTIVDILHSTMNNIDARKDTGVFLDSCVSAFSRFPEYKFQPSKDDQITSIYIDETNKEMVETVAADLKNNVQFSLVEVNEIWKTIEEAANNLNNLISQQDYEVADLFLRSKLTRTKESLSSTSYYINMESTDENLYTNKRTTVRDHRIEQEKFYIDSLKRYLMKNELYNSDIAKLEKFVSALGDLYSMSGDSPQEELDISLGVGSTSLISINTNHNSLTTSSSTTNTSIIPTVNNSGSSSAKLTRQLTKKGHRRLGVKELQSKPRLFGGSLEDYCEKSGQTIPLIIKTCVRVINQFGMKHQGIFRIPGSQTEMVEYREFFEKGDKTILTKQFGPRDVNSIAGLLKLYFRELVEPIFPNCIFNRLIECLKEDGKDEEIVVVNIRDIINDLSDCTFGVLRYLFGFLNHLCDYQEDNMMDAQNLAICLGPCLMPLPSDLSQLQFEYQPFVNQTIRLLIDKYWEIFDFNVDKTPQLKYDRQQAIATMNSINNNNSITDENTDTNLTLTTNNNNINSSNNDVSIEETDNISDMSLDIHSLASSSNILLNDKDEKISTDENGANTYTDNTNIHTITRCESTRYPDNFKQSLEESILNRPHLTRKLSDSDMKAMTYAMTIADYRAASPKELSFSRNQTVKLYRRLNQHWWEGCINTSIDKTNFTIPFQIGLIPHSYLNIDKDSVGSLKKFGQNKSTTCDIATTPNCTRKLSMTDSFHLRQVDIQLDDNEDDDVGDNNEIGGVDRNRLIDSINNETDVSKSIVDNDCDRAENESPENKIDCDDYDMDEALAQMMQGFVNLEQQNTIRLKTMCRQRLEEETLALEKKFISPLSKHTPDLVRDVVAANNNNNNNSKISDDLNDDPIESISDDIDKIFSWQQNYSSDTSSSANTASNDEILNNQPPYHNEDDNNNNSGSNCSINTGTPPSGNSADTFALQGDSTVRKRLAIDSLKLKSDIVSSPSPILSSSPLPTLPSNSTTPKVGPPLAPKPKLYK